MRPLSWIGLLATLATFGCGGGEPTTSLGVEAAPASPEVPQGWTASDALSANLVRDHRVVGSRAKAEGLVKHQRVAHCGEELVAVRCEPRRAGWDCMWITMGRSGTTRLSESYPRGIPVDCA